MIVGAVQVACRLARAGQHVQRSGLEIDDRSRADADDGNNEGAVYGIGGDRSDAFGTGEADLAQRRRGIAFGIEGVDGVVFRSDVGDVGRACVLCIILGTVTNSYSSDLYLASSRSVACTVCERSAPISL